MQEKAGKSKNIDARNLMQKMQEPRCKNRAFTQQKPRYINKFRTVALPFERVGQFEFGQTHPLLGQNPKLTPFRCVASPSTYPCQSAGESVGQ